MNWRLDPRTQKLLEKATLESLIRCYFERVYGKKEITVMENTLKNALAKYDKKDLLYEKLLENDENTDEPFINECLDTLCEKTFNRGRDHSPKTLLILAKLFIKVGDHRIACEVIWCCASLAIQEFVADRQLKVELYSHKGKRGFARTLLRDIGVQFCVFELCHSAFYTNSHGARDVNFAFMEVNDFIEKLRTFHLSDEKKKELEENNFNY